MEIYIIIVLACGFLAGAIGSSKGLGFGGYFMLGILLGIIGVIIAAAAGAKPAPGPVAPPLPVPPGPGWWIDPSHRFDRRYFDGRRWTEHVTRDGIGSQFIDPLAS